MTQVQLESLTEDERYLLFYIVNITSPTIAPKIQYDVQTIKWFRHDMLVKRLLDCFNRLTKESHPTYSSLLEKMGTTIQIKYEEKQSSNISSEIPLPLPQSVENVAVTEQTISSETTNPL
jgi:hypothetical protein